MDEQNLHDNNDDKRAYLSVFIVGLIVISFFACCLLVIDNIDKSNRTKHEAEQASIRAHESEHNQTVTSFPHKMTISGKTAHLSSVDIFETKVNHGYVAHLVITIDRGQLTDDDMYWILKGYRYDWELDASALWWPESTESDSDSLHFLDCVYTDSNIYFFFYTDLQRYSLKNTTFTVHITYLQDGADYSEQYRYLYIMDFSGDKYHSSSDFLPIETLKVLIDSLEDANS